MNQMELAALRPLARRFANVDAALAEVARLCAELTLPKGAVHVVSDVHGEDVKLRHVVNNASGTLRPLVEKLFGPRLSTAECRSSSPSSSTRGRRWTAWRGELSDPPAARPSRARAAGPLHGGPRPGRALPGGAPRRLLPRTTPTCCASCCTTRARGPEYVRAIIEPLVRAGRDQHLIRLIVRLVRDLAVYELIVAGDLVDRGPRGDRVIEYLRRQPNVSFIWGNHDVAWLGAALGQEALIAQVLRISIRYRRLSQLEEGYGITLQPLEHLVRTVYKDDPAESFAPKGTGLRETQMMARMQKAAAVMQWKLEGQTIARHPDWRMDHRRLMRGLHPAAGTVEIDGKTHALRDRSFPTLDPAHPEELSAEERKCMDRLRRSFLSSTQLWAHVKFLSSADPCGCAGTITSSSTDAFPWTTRAASCP